MCSDLLLAVAWLQEVRACQAICKIKVFVRRRAVHKGMDYDGLRFIRFTGPNRLTPAVLVSWPCWSKTLSAVSKCYHVENGGAVQKL